MIKQEQLNIQSRDDSTKILKLSLKGKLSVNSIILRIKIQRMVKIWIKRTRKSMHRFLVLKEWKKTQQTFISDLKIIVHKIQSPLSEAKVLTKQQQLLMFPNLSAMIKLSQDWLKELNIIIEEWNPHKTLIGKKFLVFHKFFIIYREYSNNFHQSQLIVEALKNNPVIALIQGSLPLDIQSYLIKPVQRPPKYQLLLRQYQKAMLTTHPDYPDLTIAIRKAHQVNEQNNYAMEIQTKNQKLIDLEHRYGDVLSQDMQTIRQYICQTDASFKQFKVKVFIFNDMVLVIQHKKGYTNQKDWNKENSDVYLKIHLDGSSSFVQVLSDCKYISNRLFLCGTEKNIHLNFAVRAERNRIYTVLTNAIQNLRKNENDKKIRLQNIQSKQKCSISVQLTSISKVVYHPCWKIIVTGVQKRSISPINTQTYYILKFQTILPDIYCQYVSVKWQELLKLNTEIATNCSQLKLPILDDTTQSMGYYQKKKNGSKIIEWRTVFIERYMNFIFKSDFLLPKIDQIRKKLSIRDYLWNYVTNPMEGRMNCPCFHCSSLENAKNLKQVFTAVGLSFGKQEIDYRVSNRTSCQFKTQTLICINSLYKIGRMTLNAPKQQFQTLEDRLIWLHYRSGRIDKRLIDIGTRTTETVQIRVYLMNLMSDVDYIQVQIDSSSTVEDVIEAVRQELGIKSIQDFGLFLDYNQIPKLLDLDQCIQNVLVQVGQQQIQSPKEQVTTNSGFFSKIGDNLHWLKKMSSQILLGKRSRIYLRKYITLSPELEEQACIRNPERRRILINQIFFRFNCCHLVLSKSDTIRLCTLFYVMSEMLEISEVTLKTFKIQIIKKLLPKTKWNLLDSPNVFENEVYCQVQKYKLKINNSLMKLQDLHIQVLALTSKQIGWLSICFQVTNYDCTTLPGAETDLLAGINYLNFIILRPKHSIPLLQIPLLQLDYKITPFSLFIYRQQKTYRFDGPLLHNLKKIIELYKSYAQKFHE